MLDNKMGGGGSGDGISSSFRDKKGTTRGVQGGHGVNPNHYCQYDPSLFFVYCVMFGKSKPLEKLMPNP